MEKQTPVSPEVPEHEPKLNSGLFDWAEALAGTLAFILLLFSFVVHTNTVQGESMVPTLQDGDRLIVSNLFYTPARGDIVIISKPTFRSVPIVKRIIAVAGDTVDIDFTTGEVTVNGEVLDEPYINEPTYMDLGMSYPLTVPENCVFVMGDNRNNSDDSRDPDLGVVDIGYIQGKVLTRYWPLVGRDKIYSKTSDTLLGMN